MIIGIGNIGSTSFKSKIINIDNENNILTLGQANLDKIKSEGESDFSHSIGNNPAVKEKVNVFGFEKAINLVLDWYVSNRIISSPKDIQAMGFKCVMGETNGANMLTEKILAEMQRLSFVAPVHNIPYIESINIFSKILDVPMVGVFEPSFHYSIPEFRKVPEFPWEWYEKLGIRKYGFHGSSHRYLSAMAFKLMGSEDIKLITVHLGGSSSLCAIQNGKSVDTSMNFSPNSGIIQGTRIGDVDGTALLYAMKKKNLSVDETQSIVSNDSGLKGIAGIGTEDFREIMKAADDGNKRARIAIEMYIYGIRKYIGSYAAIMGGVDCVILSGGIGEKSSYMRKRLLENMEFMGIKIDDSRNSEIGGGQGLISADYSFDSRAKVFVIPTNEELVVAYFTKRVVEEKRDLSPEEMVFRV
jgi:acetate kinase